MNKAGKPDAPREIVLLKDLAPRKTVKGGAGKFLFGQGIHSDPSQENRRKARPNQERQK